MLIKCSECGAQVSDKAPNCPKCGNPIAVQDGPHSGTNLSAEPQPMVQNAASQAANKPVLPTPTLRPFSILVSLILICGGLYLALSWVPSHSTNRRGIGQALSDILDGRDAIILDREQEIGVKVICWVLVGIGIINLIIGSTKQNARLAFCKKCDMQVVARQKDGNYNCERCGMEIAEKVTGASDGEKNATQHPS